MEGLIPTDATTRIAGIERRGETRVEAFGKSRTCSPSAQPGFVPVANRAYDSPHFDNGGIHETRNRST